MRRGSRVRTGHRGPGRVIEVKARVITFHRTMRVKARVRGEGDRSPLQGSEGEVSGQDGGPEEVTLLMLHRGLTSQPGHPPYRDVAWGPSLTARSPPAEMLQRGLTSQPGYPLPRCCIGA